MTPAGAFGDPNLVIEKGQGYFVRASSSGAVDVTGVPITGGVTIEFQAGWSLISIPTTDYMAGEVAQEIKDAGIEFQALAAWDGQWKLYVVTPAGSFGDATMPITKGNGYFVRSGNAGTWSPN